MDSGIEFILSLQMQTQLGGTADTVEGRNTTQMDLDRLERWACVNLMQFSEATCKVLHLGWGSPKHQYRLGKEWGLFCEDRNTFP